MTAAPRLRSTRDYDKFELHPQNRDVRRPDALRKSMQEYGFLPHYPIHCVENGGKLKIKAGHHRFAVASELGLPIYYVLEDDGGIGIHELERATSSWTLEDYLTSYVREGRGYYVEVRDYYRSTGIPLSSCVSMLGGHMAGTGSMSRAFKSGAFKITEHGRRHAALVADVAKTAEEAGTTFATTAAFVAALSRILYVDELDVDELRRRLVKWNHLLTPQRGVHNYVANLEVVYNHMSKEARLPLAFLADAAARARKVA